MGRPYAVYKGSTVLTPNRYETQVATGIAPRDDASLRAAAKALRKMADLRHVLITLDRDGMYLDSEGEEGVRIPTRPKEVFDVTGAGDMVVSVVALLLGCGASIRDAATLANVAAGIEVTKIGAAPVSRDEILGELLSGNVNLKLKTLASAVEMARECRRRNGKVVWTNGCFDIFHIGHYEYLKLARQQGDLLIVGLNSDASVRRLKGPQRPITGEAERARLLAALDVVDCIVVFEEDTPLEAIKAVRPDVIVKGGDYREDQVVGWDAIKSYGGKVVIAPLVEGVSTTDIVKRVLERYAR
jgi:D-beta-D-heptose 7-phosphate kinase/D-beta-D-heptose 1-phosphate adenosyltransferase